ncbi:hypothetical protein L3Q82_002294 [Scortum barcoo]|uniref:Uncharacterized protein n=1 Tax=Scortum barcoo TaxID=214431 RepID=A0ACB8VYW3_9TELE|nr:hypothetical protein L3Q82_002294 [Scortum barcoo]
MLACRTPDAVEGYRQAKQAAARTVLGGKNFGSGRSSGEAMEEASKRFWQTVRRLRRGKQYSANIVYSAGGELLTSTEGHCPGRWKKYFEDLLNPTDLPSNEEAGGWGLSEVDSSITQAEVTEVVWRKLRRWQGAGVDEIRPEYLQISGCCGAVLADTPLQHCMEVGDSASGVANWGGGPSF